LSHLFLQMHTAAEAIKMQRTLRAFCSGPLAEIAVVFNPGNA
jgi:hypothetical protein